ncbi:hypothetical protein [Limimaricola cinnabarinus]|uniref:hypothetical protein n=1 Tax=Limimaricola cinnabarinus TaxID=1125964 RepID=UPI0013A62C50|nr:hypothetical protein [Limimaricola cinnabarinus]
MDRPKTDRCNELFTPHTALRGEFTLSPERHCLYHRLVSELSQLSDDELATLGCDRLGIPQLARETARRAMPRSKIR